MIAKSLKQAQPYRERPSKDRSRRFMVGELPLDHVVNDEHNLITNQFWTIHPSNTVLQSAKVFLLSHILYIAESGKPKNSSIKSNPNTKIILNMYDYDKKTKLYHPSGRSGLVQESRTLITDVSNYIVTAPEGISLDHGSISDLSELEPFHSDLDLTSVIPASSSVSSTTDNESDPYIHSGEN